MKVDFGVDLVFERRAAGPYLRSTAARSVALIGCQFAARIQHTLAGSRKGEQQFQRVSSQDFCLVLTCYYYDFKRLKARLQEQNMRTINFIVSISDSALLTC